ncbi:MAG: tRNA (N6-isopentenyl adenosine(37)-C2)-methylthiotransferase MiaB [Nitrospiraceae bacterium]|nr:MAG: tRNA (N6-isopentenyl adenosine(37)-C2)-methylthiotransferase MiaB [Nitrospiraceae bacterium]
MNVHDSEKMLGILGNNGYVAAGKPEDADVIIFNTCAIREKAEQKFFSQLGRTKQLKKKNHNLTIAVAGCVAQSEQETVRKRAPHVDVMLGPQNIGRISDMVSGQASNGSFDENHELAYEELFVTRSSRIKAWISIMYGCNNFCSYCIVPYTRGREVSRPSSSIVSEVLRLRGQGYREITLLGQNVNSYKSDCDFTELLRLIDKTEIERMRFVTSHPRDLSLELIRTMQELPSVCEHVHLPLQAGSDNILRMMNRGYTYGEYQKKVDMLREAVPDIAITTDIITGFPGETRQDFEQTVYALNGIEYDGIFAFKYSPRKGTTAFDMENTVPDEEKSERLNRVLQIQEEITYKKNRKLEGTTQEVLIEGSSDTDTALLSGRTRTNKIVTLPDSGDEIGSFVSVLISKARRHSLSGEKC